MDNRIPIIALISSFYIFGLSAFYTGGQIVFASAICLILVLLALFDKLKPALCIVLCLFFFAGFYNARHQNQESDDLSTFKRANNIKIQGRVYSIPNISSNRKTCKFFLRVYTAAIKNKKFTPKKTKVLVSIYDEDERYKDIKIGDIIEIEGNLRTPGAARNPSEFDYQKYLKNKDVFKIVYSNCNNKNGADKYFSGNFKVLSHPDIKNAQNKPKEAWWLLLQTLDLTREKIILNHGKYIKSPNLEVLGGIVFGDDAINPPDEIKESFINSGLLHLLAASGLNVALIFGIWWWVSGFISLPHKVRLCFGAVMILIYTFTTGFPPSILRATIMLILILIGKLMFRTADNLALIFFTGFIILLFNPKLLNDVGFQLSFLVTGGLITCIEPICTRFKRQDKLFKKMLHKKFTGKSVLIKIFYIFSPISLLSMGLVPLVAQLWAAPLQMYYFNTFTPYSVFANIAVVPFIGIISFAGFLSSIINYITGRIEILADFAVQISSYILNPLISILLYISEYFSNLPGAIVKMPSPGALWMIIYYILILVLAYNIKNGFKAANMRKALILLFLVLIISSLKISGTTFNIHKNFEILAFDVGNADNFLITTPGGKYLMIDTGRLPYKGISTARRITLEYLYDKNIRSIEKLIVTHFDSDHSGGTIDILENIKVRETIIQNNVCDTENSCNILDYIKRNKIQAKSAQNREVIYKEQTKDGVFEVITYVPKISKFKNSTHKVIKGRVDKIKAGHENEESIIVLIKVPKGNMKYDYSIFMADGGVQAFNAIKNQLPKGIEGNVKVLKAGHHGAKNVVNKTMLEFLKPEYTIISTGYNTYGHPNPETIELLRNSGTTVYSTKDFGAIKLVFRKNKAIISTFSNNNSFFSRKLAN